MANRVTSLKLWVGRHEEFCADSVKAFRHVGLLHLLTLHYDSVIAIVAQDKDKNLLDVFQFSGQITDNNQQKHVIISVSVLFYRVMLNFTCIFITITTSVTT